MALLSGCLGEIPRSRPTTTGDRPPAPALQPLHGHRRVGPQPNGGVRPAVLLIPGASCVPTKQNSVILSQSDLSLSRAAISTVCSTSGPDAAARAAALPRWEPMVAAVTNPMTKPFAHHRCRSSSPPLASPSRPTPSPAAGRAPTGPTPWRECQHLSGAGWLAVGSLVWAAALRPQRSGSASSAALLLFPLLLPSLICLHLTHVAPNSPCLSALPARPAATSSAVC